MNEEEKRIFVEHLTETRRCIDTFYKITKWLIIMGIVGFVAITSVFGMTLWYLYQYDYSSTTTTTVEQSTEGGGDANYIGKDGIISYGETKDNNDNYKD